MNTPNFPNSVLRGRPLPNITCPYCGTKFDTCSKTKEHVIGRNFVPGGTLENRWNLILNACSKCNRRKSDLEDDVSAICMHFHTVGFPCMSDPRAQAEARRKSDKSISRKTRKAISSSNEEHNISLPLGDNNELTFRFRVPPQFDDERVYELARFHMMAFFYLLTYDDALKRGQWWKGSFNPVHGSIKTDWGNSLYHSFMNQCCQWECHFILADPDGYFCAAIRKHPVEESYSWAIQWNDCYRLIGYFGDPKIARMLADELSPLKVRSMFESPDAWVRTRNDKLLAEDDDILFIAHDLA